MRRCLALAVVLIAGCRCKGSHESADAPPPPRPADVLCEAVVPDPSATWGRVHDVLGIAALSLPSSAFSLLTRAYHLPSGLEHRVEPRGPVVGLLFEEEYALAWRLGDPDRMATFEKLELRPTVQGVRFAAHAHRPYGLAPPFLVAGSSEAGVVSHLPYLTTGLARSSHPHDARIELTSRGVRSEAVGRAAAHVERMIETLGEDRADAPSARDATLRALGDLGRAWHGWMKAERAVRIELSIASDAVTISAGSLDSAPTKVAIPGEVLRWWVRSQARKF